MRASQRVLALGREMLVHGTEAALARLAQKHTADEALAAASWAEARRGLAAYWAGSITASVSEAYRRGDVVTVTARRA